MVTGKDDIDTIDYDIHSTHGLDVQILFDVTKSESIYGITINIIKRRRVCVYIFFFPLYRTEEIGSCDSKKEREREKKAAFHSRGKIQRRASRRRINIHDERVYIYVSFCRSPPLSLRLRRTLGPSGGPSRLCRAVSELR